MLCTHPDHPELGVRLAYGLNLYPSRDAEGVLAGLRALALPLRAMLAPAERGFGVGAWLPARAAREFLADERRAQELGELCLEGGLDPCTFNAFPHGEFHGPGLKERVFAPSWKEHARLEFTLDVARIAARLRARRGGSRAGAHLSLSTHAGMFAPTMGPGDREALAEAFVRAAVALSALESECGERVVLALEPEPRSSANDTRELAALLDLVRARARGAAEAAAWRHLGACLDACHAAVEFEPPGEAFARATARGTTLGKLQFSSALALARPGADDAARAKLLALDEPVYLHQVTGRRGARFLRALDLPEVARQEDAWRECDEWRCHFHVPVDLAEFGGAGGLATTRREAEELLEAALSAPERWGSRELHVEVETYTWNLFDPSQTGAAGVLEGLARELTHVLGLLRSAGWRPLD
jgi:sugar phosphate isomerase/epimerase